jgi:hypothetical protein
MAEFSPEEQDEIIRDYFGPSGAEETPRCPRCGDLLQFDVRHASGTHFQMQVSCSDCHTTDFHWEQTEPEQPWKPLHLNYFVERYRLNERIRCPIDDCYISFFEFSDEVVEFRCPYCNRRGKASVS